MGRPACFPIAVYRGDTFRLPVIFQDADEAPVDKTDCTYTAQLRASPESPDVLAEFTCTAGDATGIVYVTMDSTLTAALAAGRRAWDLQEYNTATASTFTKLAGRADVVADVTRPVP